MNKLFLLLLPALLVALSQCSQSDTRQVSPQKMQEIYNEVATPFKYGMVLSAPDSTHMVDSPTVFRLQDRWYMTYIVFDGKGYETWLAESDDLLHWKTLGKTMQFTRDGWDATQKAGYVSLIDPEWGGSYAPGQYDGKYWISYLGGSVAGYEAGRLGVGMAHTEALDRAEAWTTLSNPVLSASDEDARWYDNKTIFKSSIIYDDAKHTGYPYLMFYNAAGDSLGNGHQFESIAMAGSSDLHHWTRMGDAPVITRGRGICGDAQIVKMDDLYVMFYFGHNWRDGDGAFERFACSYDLKTWTEWQGANLVEPSEGFDKQYAHKPWVIKWNGVVYHFYNAVGDKGRVIALATSKDLRQP